MAWEPPPPALLSPSTPSVWDLADRRPDPAGDVRAAYADLHQGVIERLVTVTFDLASVAGYVDDFSARRLGRVIDDVDRVINEVRSVTMPVPAQGATWSLDPSPAHGVDAVTVFDAPSVTLPAVRVAGRVAVEGVLMVYGQPLSKVDALISDAHCDDGEPVTYHAGEIVVDGACALFGPGERIQPIATEARGGLTVTASGRDLAFSATVVTNGELNNVAAGGELVVRYAIDTSTGRPVLAWIQLAS